MTHQEALARIRFHSDTIYGKSHPAVNVKVYTNKTPDGIPDKIANQIWQDICSEFWNDFAPQIAKRKGYSGVFSEGRMEGWCIPYYGMSFPNRRGQADYRFPDVEGDEQEALNFIYFQEEILQKVKSRQEDYTAYCQDWINNQKGANKLECPYCHKQIGSIVAYGQQFLKQDLWTSKSELQGELQYGDFDYGDVDFYKYECFECNHSLTEEEVAQVLKVNREQIPDLVKDRSIQLGSKQDICPSCSTKLEHKPGFYTDEDSKEHSYDGVVCPHGCDLFEEGI